VITYEQIKEGIKTSIASAQAVDAAKVAEACEAIQAAATQHYGAGVYVSGSLAGDVVTINWKRPSIRERDTFQVKLRQDQLVGNQSTDDGDDDQADDLGSLSRVELFAHAVSKLREGDFTAGGLPKVEALNDAIGELTPFTAAERDQLWEQSKSA
jgi:hypothetical protein